MSWFWVWYPVTALVALVLLALIYGAADGRKKGGDDDAQAEDARGV